MAERKSRSLAWPAFWIAIGMTISAEYYYRAEIHAAKIKAKTAHANASDRGA